MGFLSSAVSVLTAASAHITDKKYVNENRISPGPQKSISSITDVQLTTHEEEESAPKEEQKMKKPQYIEFYCF